MGNRKITNCGDCAYVDKSDGKMWCPFHDEPVSNRLVCDDFLDEFESPTWLSLATGINGHEEKAPQYLARDIIAYGITVFLWLLYIVIVIVSYVNVM